MGTSTYIPYISILGLTIQSMRWNESMKGNVAKMAFRASRAAELKAGAVSEHAMAEDAMGKAKVDKAKAALLEEEGKSLIAQGERDAALGEADEVAAEELLAKAGEEETTALSETAEAAVQESIFEENLAKANADAGLASKHAFQADEGEVAIGLCQSIPFVDVLCDFIGGAASISLDARATEEAARSAVEYTAAASAKTLEDSLLAEAAELHAASISDGEAAAELEASAKELEAKSEMELSEGEADKAAADEKIAQSQAEEKLGMAEETEATGQEGKAAENLAKSLENGVSAWLDALLAGFSSVLSFAFFMVRIIFNTAPSSIQGGRQISQGNALKSSFLSVRTLSHSFHHLYLICIVSGIFGDNILNVKTLNITSRGELIIQLAATTSISQSLLLHCHSNEFVFKETTLTKRVIAGLIVLTRSFLILFLLVILEILIFVIFLPDSFLRVIIPFFGEWYLYFFFTISILSHYIFIDRLNWSKTYEGEGIHDSDNEQTSLISKDSYFQVRKLKYGSDDSCSEKNQRIGARRVDLKATTHFQHLRRDFELLIFPLEVLIISLMAALLRSCLPNLSGLWTTVKPIIMSKRYELPGMILPVSILIIIIIAYTFWLKWYLRSSNSKKHGEGDKSLSRKV